MKSALTSKFSAGSSMPCTIEYDSETLRNELSMLGYTAGPITPTTKRVYLKKLQELKKHPIIPVENNNIRGE